MEIDDPFGSIIKYCIISSSQEEILRGLKFATEPGEPLSSDAESTYREDIPLESTGIVLASPPETTRDKTGENNTPHDIFHTPPEESVPVDNLDDDSDGDDVVDLGRDADLGFSELELTQRIESEGIEFESEEVRVLKRETPSGEGISESLSKRSKITHSGTSKSCLRIGTDGTSERLVKSIERLKFKGISPYNKGTPSEIREDKEISLHSCRPEIQQGNETCEGSLTKRKLDFSAEVMELQNEEGNSDTRSVKDIDKYRYVGGSVGLERKARGLRVLPVSVRGPLEENGEGKSEAKKNSDQLDVLKMLARDTDDGDLKGLSVLDVAKRRAMTFPQPGWLPVSVRGVMKEDGGGTTDGGGRSEAKKNSGWTFLLDVLKMLARDTDHEHLKGLSVLEVAKSCGMTFPQPRWWPKEGCNVGDELA
ncbi:hypothetical protein CFOL_v3_23227 [Cephalotus follicularis]|uniref:Uncharacterized protein n=1 Tax=Cephalotus follicularis TaxID=3775 RepID=A0A1Q3CHM5_CEPFO|nr:hypothetical protein CFOL_v3_23227 [Cephalotus follicularis]